MKSIAVTKPDMGVLSRERLLLSPFGALSQAFGEELLARAQQSEGVWPYVPLELLEEGEEPPPPAAPVKPVLHIDLQLVLEALRREGLTTPQLRATERIVERILQLQTRSALPGKQAGPASSPAPSLSVFGTIRQEFHPQLIQNIRISAPASQPKAMGELARKARDFSHRLQALREEGASPAREVRLAQGTIQPVSPVQAPPPGPASGGTAPFSPLPQQALTLLEEQERQAAPFQEQNTRLLRQMDQLQTLLEAGERRDTKSGSRPARPEQAADHSPRSPSHPAGGRETETHPRKGEPDPTSQLQEVTHGHSPAAQAQSSLLPAAGKQAASSPSPRELPQAAPAPSPRLSRDIRVNGDSPQGTISPLAPAAQALGQTAGILAPGSVSGAAAPILPRLGQPPVELTLPTEEQGTPGQAFSQVSPGKEPPKQSGRKTPPPAVRRTDQPGQSNGSASSPLKTTAPSPEPVGGKLEQPAVQAKPPGQSAVLAVSPALSGKHRTREYEKTASGPDGNAVLPLHTSSRPPSTAARDIRWNLDIPLGTLSPREPAPQPIGQTANVPLAPGQAAGGGAPIFSGAEPLPVELRLPTGEKEAGEPGLSTPARSGSRPDGHTGSVPAGVLAQKPGQPVPNPPAPATQSGQSAAFPSLQQAPAWGTSSEGEAKKSAAARDIRVHPHTPLGAMSLPEFSPQAMDPVGGASLVPGQAAVSSSPMLPNQGRLPVELALPMEEKGAGEPGFSTPVHSGSAPGRHTGSASAGASLNTPGHKSGQSAATPSAPAVQPGQSAAFPFLQQAPAWRTSSEGEAKKSAAAHRAVPFPPPAHPAFSGARDIRVNFAPPLGHISAREPAPQAAAQWAGIPLVPGQAAVGPAPNLPEQGQLPVELTLSPEERGQPGQAFSPASSPKENPGPSSREIFPKSAVTVENLGREAAKSAVSGESLPSVFHGAFHPVSRLARDIRVNRGDAAPEAGHTPLRTPPPIHHLTDRPTGEDASGVSAGPAQAASHLSGTASPGVSPMAQPLSLTYGPAQGNPSFPPPEPHPDGEPSPAEESDFVRSLPDWARRFLKQSRTPSAPSHAMGVARDIAALPASQEPETTQWVAPNYQPPQAAITHREKKQEERPKQAQEVQISEAEIQRTADRVYRIIEDRIRRERRRLGL